jgi:hypothetical protein
MGNAPHRVPAISILKTHWAVRTAQQMAGAQAAINLYSCHVMTERLMFIGGKHSESFPEQ